MIQPSCWLGYEQKVNVADKGLCSWNLYSTKGVDHTCKNINTNNIFNDSSKYSSKKKIKNTTE